MEEYIKKSTLVVVAFYAVFAAIVAISYVLDGITQVTLVDWLLKGGLIAVIVVALNVVIAFITQRKK